MLVKPLLVAMDAQDLDVEIWFNVAFSCFWVMLDMVVASHCRQTCRPLPFNVLNSGVPHWLKLWLCDPPPECKWLSVQILHVIWVHLSAVLRQSRS